MAEKSISKKGRIKSVSGPLAVAETFFPVRMLEVVRVGSAKLAGEVVRIRGSEVDIRICEDTAGLCVGEEVLFTGLLPGLELGPGFLGQVLDGLGHPLRGAAGKKVRIGGGGNGEGVHGGRMWHFVPSFRTGDRAGPGDVLGTIVEGNRFPHRVLVPPFVAGGAIEWIAPEGEYAAEASACRFSDGTEVGFKHRWELHVPRPVKRRLPPDRPFLTGQRVLDTLFPLASGGTAALPGGFGTGKTLIQRSLARGCNADVVVYIACGGRGNEIAEILDDFAERTILIAAVADMPVTTWENGIRLGMTLAEYYRDMGNDVAVMIDSISRWAEALKEIGGRLGETPGEDGYPAYLAGRLSRWCERAGQVEALGTPSRRGSITLINAFSPAGGDFSEPVTAVGRRLSGALWCLDRNMAQARHFPAVDRRRSYSLYDGAIAAKTAEEAGSDWPELKCCLKDALLREREIAERREGAGGSGLSEEERWALRHAENLRIVYLQQDARDEGDSFSSMKRSAELLRFLKALDESAKIALKAGLGYDGISACIITADLIALRGLPEKDLPAKAGEWLGMFENRLAAFEETPEQKPKGTSQ